MQKFFMPIYLFFRQDFRNGMPLALDVKLAKRAKTEAYIHLIDFYSTATVQSRVRYPSHLKL